MSEDYDAKLCQEWHKVIDEKLNLHNVRLNDHSDRIKKLERRSAAVDERVENLCEQLKNLVNTLKWGFGILVTITLFVLGYLMKIKN
ncbi:hypothetical protein BJV85_003457 [Clostridium acetobutylicum]|uniref:Hemolysin XhlA n=1 Tax=Clostridium acetobutylicum (strain ATCC 824 / DSM 792 / JCM 1419 / IAM 19013 / LMG 5710 / NBRC 13948 / NRRL B-527 / VKM B-1787 / 2291 / W) TaxID=272562 RepID=Q97LK6_CLOAB|nr:MULTISPECIES: hemolysin XhlA family protein [Clostridium]AAK78532.1 Hypothetical protein, CF-8 family [Clostridium acetobutylicum ATCC 824]ADZ19605.1 conserved hypothetical protein [Clostridium acetobutylicum EA 2018]AEI31306.1 hypothetical protein SMB_G0565 [Clostridium acetobutylicum DSM 1731]AWV80254.1 hypothetical protein DK921_09135 [Clostridium acetobutylicum]KHD37678.1 membrane protein [Clostridium acetobutylicum]